MKSPSKNEQMKKMEAQFDKEFKRTVDEKMEAPVTPRVEMLRETIELVSKN